MTKATPTDQAPEEDPAAGDEADTGGEAETEADGEAEGAAEAGGEGPPPTEPPAPPETMLGILRETYLTFDRRTLGFTRILLGFFLIMDLWRRTSAWMDMYSTEGVLPNDVNLARPQGYMAISILNGFSTPPELAVLWVIILATYVCLLLGYKTKVAQILSFVFVSGMNVRVTQIENGGYVVHNLLLMWTAFLPLGDRFSLDALFASMKRRREASADELNDRSDVLLPEKEQPLVTLLGLVLVIQLAAIYFFNVVHKTGPAWKNGTAVHYVLYVDRMVTPIVAHTRDYLPNWAILFMTRTTLTFEGAIPLALLSPLGRPWARRLAIVMINALHLGFGIAMTLGPFAWALCIFSTLLFAREDWEIAIATMRREHRARTVIFDPTSPGAVLFCRLLKRFDRFELLVFREGEGVPLGVALEGEDDTLITRSACFADLLAALPLGPALAWALRAPVLSGLFDRLFGWLETKDVSGWLGLTLRPSFTASATSPLRRGGRKTLATLRELGILAMFVAEANQAAVELWVINRRFKIPQPEPLKTMALKMRLLQGWFMFSPNPVMDDGTLVVDAVTIDGRHIDPFTQKEPDFDLLHAKSLGLSQLWGDYYNRMHLGGYTWHRDAMKEYMLRLPKRTGRVEDTLVSGDVYWVQDLNPKWNETQSYNQEKVKVFSFDNPAGKAMMTAPPAAPQATP
jgi:Vitamin K-dependent gamma-carboxylase